MISLQNVDRTHAFSDSDQQLLETLAGSLSVALENARLVDETRQRNAELALINSVQEALAGEFELQAIYDAVGDRIRDVFDAQVLDIAIYDEPSGLLHFPYTIERGVRFPDEPIELIGFRKHVIETRETLMIEESTPEVAERYGNPWVLSGEPVKAALFVPLVVGGRATGVISLQNIDRTHAFSDSDQQLLETLAGSLSVALENARLVDETRQRNAELALINSVQEALAGELELQAIYDAVGDRIRDVFDAQVLDIGIYDEPSELLHFPYTIERGVRFPDEPIELIGFRKHVIETRETLMIEDRSTPEMLERWGNPSVLSGEPVKSMLFVPLVVGGRATGVISLQNIDRTHAFSDSDQQLLETLAGSLSVALENARLVHETRQRNAELALINGVQGAIAGELDPLAIYDLVGDKIRDVFDAQVVSISVYDEASGVLTFPYVIERGERLDQQPIFLIGFRKHVMETREPLMIGEITRELAERYGNPWVLSGEPVKSALFVPVVVSGRATGVISLQNVDRTHAFGEDDLRLLTTLAGSLSVALDNARLLHETRQRVAELATVNSVGQALSSQLDLDALIELVGEQVRGTFERRHRLRRPPRPAVGTDRLRLLLRERAAPGRAVDGVRRRAGFPDPRLARAARAQPLAAVRGARAAPDRHPGTVLPGRPDPARRRGNRGHQRPEHRGGRPFRRSRLAIAGDDRSQCRRGDPERSPVRRGGAPAPVPGVARRDQPRGGGRHGRRGAGDRLEPGRGRAVRLLGRGGARPAHRRPRLRRRRTARRVERSPRRP